MPVDIRISETGSHDNDEAIVPVAGISRVSSWRRVALVLAQTSAVVLLLFVGLTQVYANVQAFGWSGFIALILLTPVLSLGHVWLNIKLRKAQ